MAKNGAAFIKSVLDESALDPPEEILVPSGTPDSIAACADFIGIGFYIDETAQILRLCRATVYDLLNTGTLRAKHVHGRTVVLRTSVAEYIASLPDYRPGGKR